MPYHSFSAPQAQEEEAYTLLPQQEEEVFPPAWQWETVTTQFTSTASLFVTARPNSPLSFIKECCSVSFSGLAYGFAVACASPIAILCYPRVKPFALLSKTTGSLFLRLASYFFKWNKIDQNVIYKVNIVLLNFCSNLCVCVCTGLLH